MTYENRINSKAEEFARADFGGAFENLGKDEQDLRIHEMRPLAILAIAGEARAMELIVIATSLSDEYVQNYLRTNGYLPTELKAEGKDGK